MNSKFSLTINSNIKLTYYIICYIIILAEVLLFYLSLLYFLQPYGLVKLAVGGEVQC